MVLASASLITLVPRCWRMYLAEWLISRCRLPATPALIFPLAVILKRFLAPDLVFSLGISLRRSRELTVLFENRISRAALACLWARRLARRRGLYGKGRFKARSRTAPDRSAARPADIASRIAGATMRAAMRKGPSTLIPANTRPAARGP